LGTAWKRLGELRAHIQQAHFRPFEFMGCSGGQMLVFEICSLPPWRTCQVLDLVVCTAQGTWHCLYNRGRLTLRAFSARPDSAAARLKIFGAARYGGAWAPPCTLLMLSTVRLAISVLWAQPCAVWAQPCAVCAGSLRSCSFRSHNYWQPCLLSICWSLRMVHQHQPQYPNPGFNAPQMMHDATGVCRDAPVPSSVAA